MLERKKKMKMREKKMRREKAKGGVTRVCSKGNDVNGNGDVRGVMKTGGPGRLEKEGETDFKDVNGTPNKRGRRGVENKIENERNGEVGK